jgi:hypothetical protein
MVQSALDTIVIAISESGLAEEEKGPLLSQVATTQHEAAVLSQEVGVLRMDTERLNRQLTEQRELNTALQMEHDRREAAAATVQLELAATLAKVKRQRNLYLALLIVVCLGILGYIAFRVLL